MKRAVVVATTPSVHCFRGSFAGLMLLAAACSAPPNEDQGVSTRDDTDASESETSPGDASSTQEPADAETGGTSSPPESGTTSGPATTGTSSATSGPESTSTSATNTGPATDSGSGEPTDTGEDESTGTPPPRPEFDTLREAAAAAGKLLGVAVSSSALRNDATYTQILEREFDYVTPENSAKWGPLAPARGTYDWRDTDTLVDFAERFEQQVKGHTFVWHIQAPTWISESMSRDDLNAALKSHIETTLARYRGRMRAWDVVNEAVDVSTSSGYTESVFFKVLGPEYIENAYRWARAADPDILLLYNEVGIERMGPKADFTYDMIRDLLDRGVPIDGIGFQSHVSTHRYPSESDLRANIRRFADLGLKVNISEIDARTKLVPGDQAFRWHAQRIAFQQLVGACTVEPGCEAITFWGFSDNYSWINDDGPEDPLVYDRQYIPKPAYDGIMDGLAGLLPRRGTNVLLNADFSRGNEGWSTRGGMLSVATAEGRDGQAACIRGRTGDGDGLVQQGLLPALAAGGPMAFSSWVRVNTASTVDATLVIDKAGAAREEFNIATIAANGGSWIELSGYLTLGFDGTPTAIELEIDGPEANVELCVAEVALQPLTVD